MNRVVYVFGSELKESVIKTITPTVLSKECTNQLGAADDIVNQTLIKYDLIRKLSQVPVILFLIFEILY